MFVGTSDELSFCFSIAFMINAPYGEYLHWDAVINKRIAAAG